MDNQENLEELQEFDLEAILSEFHDDPEGTAEEPAEGPVSPTLPSLDEEEASELQEAAEVLEAADTAFEEDLSDLLGDLGDLGEEETAPGTNLEDTQIFDVTQELAADHQEAATSASQDTLRFGEDLPRQQEEPKSEPIPIRTGLRELRKKIIAGPEKRYYELADQGVFSLQVAILLNLLLVVFCIGSSAMFTAGVIPENRLRFVIFTQVLSMLLSALLGCYQLMDGLGELFHGRFTINTLLFFTLIACCVDAVFCFQELRIPCCSGFALQMTFALLARYHRRTTETYQMDTLRKANHLNATVKEANYLDGKPALLRTPGDVDAFTENYQKPSGPEKLQGLYCLVSLLACLGLGALAGTKYSVSLGVQVLSVSLMAAVPASFFVTLTRPACILEHRLHMVGSVICGWQGVTKLRGKACFPLTDEDLFPMGSTKLNGVKFYGNREPEQILSYASSLISAAGGGLVPLFQNMLKNRGGSEYPVSEFRDYGIGGVGGVIRGETVLLGNLEFLQSMDVYIPQGTTVSQAVYMSIEGELSAVIAISYAKMRSSSAGLTSLGGYRKVQPVMLTEDFMLTGEFLHNKFSINTRRFLFPDRDTKRALAGRQPDPEAVPLALSTRDELVGAVYPITGANALFAACRLGMLIHILGGIVGMFIMFALAFQGSTELLTPTNILLYQLIWMVPGMLVTEWARTV